MQPSKIYFPGIISGIIREWTMEKKVIAYSLEVKGIPKMKAKGDGFSQDCMNMTQDRHVDQCCYQDAFCSHIFLS